jgi:hypothetical protein
MKIQKVLSIFLLSFVLLLALAACGGPGSSSADDGLPPTDTVVPLQNPVDDVITIFDTKIVSSVTTFKPGVPYTFYVRNFGKKHHQFVLLLSALDGSTMTPAQLQKAALISVPDLAPEGTNTIDYIFPASTAGQSYQMASYLKGDYTAGLKLLVTVKS